MPLPAERSVYLDAYLAPFQRWLDVDTITEILVNRPGDCRQQPDRRDRGPVGIGAAGPIDDHGGDTGLGQTLARQPFQVILYSARMV